MANNMSIDGDSGLPLCSNAVQRGVAQRSTRCLPLSRVAKLQSVVGTENIGNAAFSPLLVRSLHDSRGGAEPWLATDKPTTLSARASALLQRDAASAYNRRTAQGTSN